MQIDVNINSKKIAILKYDGNTFSLDYTKEWQDSGYAISPYLPLDKKIDSKNIEIFLQNLLPEGRALDEMVNFLQISKSNTFAIINSIGFDTSGALNFGKIDNDINRFREISPKELAKRIKNIDIEAISIWDNKPRLSIAGVQEKLPVAIVNGKMGLADGKICSTHILKFQTKRNYNIAINEFFCMKLASSVGLSVADVELKRYDGEVVLFVKRFDRLIKEDIILKLHIIDANQALNLPPHFKYERAYGSSRDVKDIREGVSFKKLAKVAKLTKAPALTTLKIIDWALFNLLIANSDAHGKNISFFVDKKGIDLAPFYDLISIAIYPHIEHDFAFAYGDEFDIDSVLAYDLKCFASDLNINPKLIEQRLNIICKKIEESINNVDFGNFKLNDEEREFIGGIKELILKRVNKYKEISKDICRVSD